MRRTVILPLADGDVADTPRRAPEMERRLPMRKRSTIPRLATAVLVMASMPGATVSADPARYGVDARLANVSSCPAPHRLEGCNTFSALPPYRHSKDNSIRLAQATEIDSRKPQQSLEPEPRKPEALSCELGSAKHDIELLQGLAQEHDRADQLERALAAAQRDLDAQTARAAKASDEVAGLTQAAKTAAAERTRSVQKEHERAEALAQDLSIARSKIYAYEAQAAASEKAAQLKQAQESGTASSGQSQQPEHDRAEQLARDLAKATSELDAQTERASKAGEDVLRVKQARERDLAELRHTLQRERERVQELETEIALARLDNGAFAARYPSAASLPATSGTDMRGEATGAPTQQLKSELVHEMPMRDGPVHDQTTTPRDAVEARVNPDEAAQVARLLARASLLLEQGDIGGARIVLEHVAGTGNAQAIFVLAETYDPLILPSYGTYGTHGDATKARDLYARADAGGIKEAKARFEALGR
ncbi:hypothetical protein RAD15_21820 [Bradyrhizobium sp. 14AA]